MDLMELKEVVKNEPIKKRIEFEQLYEVVIAAAQKGQIPTLKMLKQVYEAYKEQNPGIADEFYNILKNSLNKERGDIPTTVRIPAQAKNIIEGCYFDMLKKKDMSQQIMDRYFGERKTAETLTTKTNQELSSK